MQWEVNPTSTHVLRLSSPTWGAMAKIWVADLVIDAVGPSQGASVSDAIGIWNGQQEREVTITIQCTRTVLDQLLDALASLKGIRFIHVERHDPRIGYVDLDERRTR